MSESLLTEPATEQNLTLGLLAVNRELISEEALCRALGIWTANPGRSLGEIFVQQGDLSPDRLADLQALTRNHLGEHGNDAARALETANRAGSDGRFRIVRLLSQGGLGEVYVAHDQELNRQVALKRIQDRHADHPECRIRFLREAEITGALEHPGIVPVYALGENAGGQPFYAMRLIQGETLQEAIYRFHQSRQPLDSHDFALRQLLGRFVAVCNAMAYAHSQGVIHRDLKPANIMLGSYGETLVLDWGLAKSLRYHEEGGDRLAAATPVKNSGVTQIGRIMGTPQFMSPEQAAGESESLTPASDIYSLGATLYCLLTGREPFVGVEEDLIPHLVRGGDFPPPRRRRPDVPSALEAICLKAMQRDPESRYPTARDLGNDIERWLADEIVGAYAEPRSAQIVRWARRHKGRVGLMAAVAALAATILVAATLLSAVSGQRLAEQRRADTLELSHNEIENLAHLAIRSEALAKRYLYFSRIGQADRAWQESQVERTLQLLNAAHEAPAEVVGFEWHYLWRLYNSSRFTLSGHRESVNCVAYSPDGKHIATGSVDRVIRIWNARTGHRVRKLLGHAGPINSVAFSPDGARLASASTDGAVKLWDLAQVDLNDRARCIGTLAEHVGSVNTVKFSLDGRRLASAGDDHTIRIWDAGAIGKPAGAKSLRVIEVSFVRILSIAFSPDSRLLASSGKGQRDNAEVMEAAVWDLKEAAGPMAILREHRGGVTGVAFSPDGRILATASDDGTAKLWNVTDLHNPKIVAIRTLKGHLDSVLALDFSSDSRRLATASEDRTVKIWAVADGLDEMTIRGHTRQINSVAFSPDSRNVASASTDTTVRVWDVTRAQEAQSLTGHGRDVNSVAFSPDGAFLATGSDDETMRVWDVVTGKEIGILGKSLGGINCVAFSPDGVLLAGANQAGKVYVWDFASRKQLLSLGAGDKSLWGLRFSPDGRHLAVASEDGSLRVWRVASTSAGAPWPCQNLRVRDDGGLLTLAFSPDGQSIATGSGDGTIHVWNSRTGIEEWKVSGHEGKIHSIAYSVDGERLATVSADCTVRIWNTTSRDESSVLRGHMQSVTAVAFSPDGRRLATGGNDRIIKLWDVETGDEALTLKGHTDTVTALAFSPDGRRLVSSSDDYTIRIWSAVPVDPAP